MNVQAVRGMKDILPEETGRWQALEALARDYFARYGFREIRTPLLERTELFVRSIGEATDVVEKEMYTLTDLSGDSLSLRPEATASICRAYVEHKLYAQPGGLKVFTIGPMFRHERPQKGRLRQFHQIDCEVIGPDAPEVDAELVSMLAGFLEACRVGQVTAKINSLGCAECRPDYRRKLVAFLEKRRGDLCPDCQRRLGLNPLRVLDCKSPRCREVVDGAPAAADNLCPACATNFKGVTARLDDLGVAYRLDHRLVRGLDYYVRTTFEMVSDKLGGQDAVAGGGRYDKLIEELDGPATPATGFAIGMERLLLLADLSGADDRPDVFLAPLGEAAGRFAFKLAHELRRAGARTALEPGERSLKAQLRRADKLAARFVLILGEAELAAGLAPLKELAGGGQTQVAISDPATTGREIITSIKAVEK